MATQSLKTVVKIGADVDKAGFKKIGSVFNKAMGESVKSVKKLEREQKDLLKQIKKTEKAGGDISQLTREYDRLGQEIKTASRKAKAFQTIQTKLGGGFRQVASVAKTSAFAITGAITGITGAMLLANNETAKMFSEAQAYGVDAPVFAVWADMADDMGLVAKDIGKIGLDMRKKIGGFLATGQGKTVGTALEKLGLAPEDLKGKDVAVQMDLIIGRLEGVKDATEQAGLANILLGNKSLIALNYLKKNETTWRDFYGIKARTNLFSKEGAKGANESAKAIGTFFGALKTGFADVSGLIGETFYREINKTTNALSDWYNLGGGRAIIQERIHDMIAAFRQFRTDIGKTVAEFGGWEKVLGAIGTGLKVIVGIWAASKIAVIIIATGQLAAAFGTLAVGITAITWPVLAVVAAIAGIAAGAYTIWKHWDFLVAEFDVWGDKINAKIAEIGEWWSQLWIDAQASTSQIWDSLLDGAKTALDQVGAYFQNIFDRILNIWNNVTGVIGSGFNKVKSWFGIGDQEKKDTTQMPTRKIIRGAQMASQNKTTNNVSNVGTINVNTQPGQSPKEFATELKTRLMQNHGGNNFDAASAM
jgi:hypothetical protein